MNQDDFFKSLLSSPQSYDLIDQTKKQVKKKKRKPVHKHLLIHNILLEEDLSKLTERQRILHKKFQIKRDEMENIDLIRSGIDIIPSNLNKKMVFKSKYKVKIPVFSKLRLKVSFGLSELYLKNEEKVKNKTEEKHSSNKNLINDEEEKNDKQKNKTEKNNDEQKNDKENNAAEIKNEEQKNRAEIKNDIKKFKPNEKKYKNKCKILKNADEFTNLQEKINEIDLPFNSNELFILEKHLDLQEKRKIYCIENDLFPNLNVKKIKKINNLNFTKNEDLTEYKQTQICLYKNNFNNEIFKKLEEVKESKIKNRTQICLYKKINIFDIFKKKAARLSLDEVDIFETNWNLSISETEDSQENNFNQDELSEKMRMINFNCVNKPMLIKKRRVLFKYEKKTNEDCINKTAFYITELENMPKYNNKIEKKCIYYTDILIKEFKKKGCVCKVVGEVKWYIKKIKEEYLTGNLSI